MNDLGARYLEFMRDELVAMVVAKARLHAYPLRVGKTIETNLLSGYMGRTFAYRGIVMSDRLVAMVTHVFLLLQSSRSRQQSD
jgi:hypothetical protein